MSSARANERSISGISGISVQRRRVVAENETEKTLFFADVRPPPTTATTTMTRRARTIDGQNTIRPLCLVYGETVVVRYARRKKRSQFRPRCSSVGELTADD